jgi:tetratricopeptide (TPR) repeat protein
MYIRLALISLILCQIQACALVKPAPADLNNNINLWLSENNYDNIDNALNAIHKNETNYRKILARKPEIYKKKQMYLSAVAKTANQYKTKNQWQLAISTYTNALEKIHNNKKLKKGLTELLNERNQNAQIIKNKLLVNRTTNLLSYKKSYDKLNKLLPEDGLTQYEIRLYKYELSKAAGQLSECAESANKSKQYSLAKDCYTQAYRIKPSPTLQKNIKSLEKTIKNNTHQKTYSSLLKSYQTAYNNKDYNEAAKSLNKILSLNPDHQQAIKLRSELKLEMRNFVTSKINLGKELYSQKKIQAALTIWKQAKELAPANSELSQLITRAEKVSKNIEILEHSQ